MESWNDGRIKRFSLVDASEIPTKRPNLDQFVEQEDTEATERSDSIRRIRPGENQAGYPAVFRQCNVVAPISLVSPSFLRHSEFLAVAERPLDDIDYQADHAGVVVDQQQLG